ncbi:hypothetical protein CONPUDRAFT_148250 [Coniophora puteana RWD-64-598 SS2]|uniref:Uncharacterized protein n=1 Tax=Coniophora puteana (strain RWD-64-598) TaxID=741705 RepID=A0A5M3N5F0_CONPW|nr:uncharacterized protein CONPUDRAFT_148250 [Coniophora puteana RWD-64-598 SS2]EIW86141.1 hypothetical protein CONPUDRAFT_148250 [Coniophora puteana RWD-64-598 SS2]
MDTADALTASAFPMPSLAQPIYCPPADPRDVLTLSDRTSARTMTNLGSPSAFSITFDNYIVATVRWTDARERGSTA